MAKSVIYELGLKGDQYLSTAKKIQTEVDRLTKRQTDLSRANLKSTGEYQKNAVALKDNKTQLNFLQKQISQNNKEQESSNSMTKKATALMNEEAVTINQLRNQNKELLNIKNNLNLANKKEAALAKEIDAKLDANTNKLKENSDAYTAQKMNIGNYASALKGLDPRIAGIVTGLQNMKSAVTAQKAALVASTNATTLGAKAMKIFKLALASTGIGLLIIALGSLVSYFSNTQRGADKVNVVMAAIGATVDVVIDRLSLFGGALVKIVNGDFSGALDDMKASVSGLGDEIRNEASAAYALEEATQKLMDKEMELIGVKAEKRKQIEELRLTAKNELTDLAKRAELLEQAGNIEKSILDDELGIARERARISSEQIALGESSRDEIREGLELKAEVTRLETASLKKQRTIEAEKQGLLKRARNEEVAAYNQRKAQKETEDKEKSDRAEKDKETQATKDQEELDRMTAFEEKKRILENEIELQNAETAEEKALIKEEQDLEKELLDLEKMQLTEEEKTALLLLLTEQREIAVAAIKAKYAKQAAKAEKKTSAQILKADKANADARANVASLLTGVLVGFLGDTLGAKLASVAIEAGIQAGLVAINSSSAQARNLAQATASAPPPANVAFIAAAGAQNALIATNSATQITKILTAGALQGVGTLLGSIGSKKKHARGGILEGDSHAQGGIQTPFGELEGGEGVINKRSMSNPFLRSLASQINEAGGGIKFAEGGVLATGSQSSVAGGSLDADSFAELLAEAVGNLPAPVVIVDEINEGQANKVEVESRAIV